MPSLTLWGLCDCRHLCHKEFDEECNPELKDALPLCLLKADCFLIPLIRDAGVTRPLAMGCDQPSSITEIQYQIKSIML